MDSCTGCRVITEITLQQYANNQSAKRALNISEKSIKRDQPARTAQADRSRYILLFVNILQIDGPVFIMFKTVVLSN